MTMEVMLMVAVIVVSAVVCFQSLGHVATDSAEVATGAVDDGTLIAFDTRDSDDSSRESTVEQSDDGRDDTSQRRSWRDRFGRWLREWLAR